MTSDDSDRHAEPERRKAEDAAAAGSAGDTGTESSRRQDMSVKNPIVGDPLCGTRYCGTRYCGTRYCG